MLGFFQCFTTFIIVFQCNIELIRSAKCSPINRADGYKYVECKTVSAMENLARQMDTTWNNVHIVNIAGAYFRVSQHSNNNLGFVKKLDLSCAGKLETDPNGFRDFTGLNTLRLKKNKINVIQNFWFHPGNNLQYLDVSRNDITRVHRENLQNLGQLVFLNFANNKIETIEQDSFADLTQLRRLIVSHNKLKEFSADQWAPNLKHLDLNGNLLANISANKFQQLLHLELLNLAENAIQQLETHAFAGLSSIKSINMSGNKLTLFPALLFPGYISVHLNALDLSKNLISTIELFAFADLQHLHTLDLSRNFLKIINETTLSGTHSLRQLFLHTNNLSSLEPRSFATLEHLEFLDLSYNELHSFTNDVFDGQHTKLKKLFLQSNNIVSLAPDTFSVMPDLYYLRLGMNKISFIDAQLFWPLTQLKKLHIGNNLIETLPGEMFNTTIGLEEFLFNDNRLTFFPNVYNQFSRLAIVMLDGNPWQCPCLDDMLKYCTDRGIQYRRSDSPYFSGLKAICIVTADNYCVKNIDAVRRARIVDSFYEQMADSLRSNE